MEIMIIWDLTQNENAAYFALVHILNTKQLKSTM
jgi:hypothetical protein